MFRASSIPRWCVPVGASPSFRSASWAPMPLRRVPIACPNASSRGRARAGRSPRSGDAPHA